jgi:anti-sigma regulatory factor (Ser/Thr protein kinase)/serine/threonine protein phosphatase PrpC
VGGRVTDAEGAEGQLLHTIDAASVALVRDAVRRAAGAVGLDEVSREGLVTAASELARNQLAHARSGLVEVRRVERSGVAGVEVVAADAGPGIRNPEAALAGGSPRAGGLGVGLSGAYRFADEADFDVRAEEGTIIRLRKFSAPVPRSEVAILGRLRSGERLSGDDAMFSHRADGSLILAVADGLGHGAEAREASRRAIDAVRAHVDEAPHEIVRHCDQAVQGTRGTVLAVVRLDRPLAQLQHAGAGNASVHVYGPKSSQRFAAPARVLGLPPRNIVPKLEAMASFPRCTVVMFTDGISTRADLTDDAEALRLPPLVVAQRLLEQHGRTEDDAIVLVAR